MLKEPSPLLTDLYQLTMLQGYLDRGMEERAVFELFVRKLPEGWNFLVACGLDDALGYLETLRFSREDLAWLESTGRFNRRCLDYLEALSFTGDADAMPEGTIAFPDEPLLRVAAPLPMAQLLETRLINLINFQTLIASKAARIVLVAQGRRLVEFGLRRAHGAEAGLLAARASYIAGFDGSSNVLAERQYGIPSFGTVAHSFVQAHQDEIEAFTHFANSFPNEAVLLIDTYDTRRAARAVVALSHALRSRNNRIRGVRIDSGDLAEHAHAVRQILDDGGCKEIEIFASGNLDEYAIEQLLLRAAPIDGFGIGTRLVTASDRPYLDSAYKLIEYAGRPVRKRSEGKVTWPGCKQVLRRLDNQGGMQGDILSLVDAGDAGLPLIQPVMRGGLRLNAAASLDEARERCRVGLAALPAPLRGLGSAPPYTVEVSAALQRLAEIADLQTTPA